MGELSTKYSIEPNWMFNKQISLVDLAINIGIDSLSETGNG